MLKLFVLVIKLNFIVTLSRCYCTSSDSPGLDFIIETVYESLGLCHCTSLSYNSLLPLQCRGPERGEEEETRGREGRRMTRTRASVSYFAILICNLIKHCHNMHKRKIGMNENCLCMTVICFISNVKKVWRLDINNFINT